MISPSYVEDDPDFKCVNDREIGCLGRLVRLRTYRLRENPDRTASDISYSVIATWAQNGYPDDAVFHLGSFERVTVT